MINATASGNQITKDGAAREEEIRQLQEVLEKQQQNNILMILLDANSLDVSKRQQIVNELIGLDPSLLKAKEEAEAALAKTVEEEQIFKQK